MPLKDKNKQTWINNFNKEAVFVSGGRKYRLTEKELLGIYSSGNYWHNKTDPSSWLSEAVVSLAKRKFYGKLSREEVIALCAQLLNISSEQLEHNLDWNANYMAWHDGGSAEDNHVWEK